MSVDLDVPYPDEPLFSVVARYMSEVRVGDKTRLLENLFGYQQRLSVTLAYGLDRVAAETSNVWALSSGELAERLTLYPYYAAMLATPRRDTLLAEMRQKQRKPSPLVAHSTLRYCDACRAADRRAGRPEYWRRSHLLPGVVLCTEHCTWLTEIPAGGRHFVTSWPALCDLSGLKATPIDLRLDAGQFDACMRVARASVWLLENHVSINADWLLAQFKKIAWDAGYTFGPSAIDCRRLTEDFGSFFGEAYLSHIGALPLTGNDNWLGTVVRGYLPARYTTRVMLAAIFLAAIRDRDSEVAWPVCPNIFADHGPEHVVERRLFVEGRYAAKCSCGFRFTYSRTEMRVPVDVRPTFYGHSHADFARRLRDAGESVPHIAAAMNISEHSVSRMIARSRG